MPLWGEIAQVVRLAHYYFTTSSLLRFSEMVMVAISIILWATCLQDGGTPGVVSPSRTIFISMVLISHMTTHKDDLMCSIRSADHFHYQLVQLGSKSEVEGSL